jgi:hypothetical protein
MTWEERSQAFSAKINDFYTHLNDTITDETQRKRAVYLLGQIVTDAVSGDYVRRKRQKDSGFNQAISTIENQVVMGNSFSFGEPSSSELSDILSDRSKTWDERITSASERLDAIDPTDISSIYDAEAAIREAINSSYVRQKRKDAAFDEKVTGLRKQYHNLRRKLFADISTPSSTETHEEPAYEPETPIPAYEGRLSDIRHEIFDDMSLDIHLEDTDPAAPHVPRIIPEGPEESIPPTDEHDTDNNLSSYGGGSGGYPPPPPTDGPQKRGFRKALAALGIAAGIGAACVGLSAAFSQNGDNAQTPPTKQQSNTEMPIDSEALVPSTDMPSSSPRPYISQSTILPATQPDEAAPVMLPPIQVDSIPAYNPFPPTPADATLVPLLTIKKETPVVSKNNVVLLPPPPIEEVAPIPVDDMISLDAYLNDADQFNETMLVPLANHFAHALNTTLDSYRMQASHEKQFETTLVLNERVYGIGEEAEDNTSPKQVAQQMLWNVKQLNGFPIATTQAKQTLDEHIATLLTHAHVNPSPQAIEKTQEAITLAWDVDMIQLQKAYALSLCNNMD